ncbi:MAG: hypothetical protein SVU88_04810 [Candidatus Nanohaloarchaea archaeon]|nr:hypothetical protein [Candidatus Nanohaloarchaea archaeon]
MYDRIDDPYDVTGALETVATGRDMELRWVNPFDGMAGPGPDNPNPRVDYDFMLWDDDTYTGVRVSYPYAVPDLMLQPLTEDDVRGTLSRLTGPTVSAPAKIEGALESVHDLVDTRTYDAAASQDIVDEVHELLEMEADEVSHTDGVYRYEFPDV